MENQLRKIGEIWADPSTAFKYKLEEKTDCNILCDLDNIYQAIDDTLAEVNMILGSRYVKPLRSRAEKWKKDILFMSDLMDEWVKCQNQWRYFYNIFMVSTDIQKQLPDEYKTYDNITRKYRNVLMSQTIRVQCPTPYKVCSSKPKTLDELKDHNLKLEEV